MSLYPNSRTRVSSLHRFRGEGNIAIGRPSGLVKTEEIAVLVHRSLPLPPISFGSCLLNERKRSVAEAHVQFRRDRIESAGVDW